MLTTLLAIPATLFALWVLYLAVMALKMARDADRLSPTAKLFGYPLTFFGVTVNVLINWTLLTLVFAEWPKETMFTHRVERHCQFGTGWRKKLACWVCHDLLDPFEVSGVHCKTR